MIDIYNNVDVRFGSAVIVKGDIYLSKYSYEHSVLKADITFDVKGKARNMKFPAFLNGYDDEFIKKIFDYNRHEIGNMSGNTIRHRMRVFFVRSDNDIAALNDAYGTYMNYMINGLRPGYRDNEWDKYYTFVNYLPVNGEYLYERLDVNDLPVEVNYIHKFNEIMDPILKFASDIYNRL